MVLPLIHLELESQPMFNEKIIISNTEQILLLYWMLQQVLESNNMSD